MTSSEMGSESSDSPFDGEIQINTVINLFTNMTNSFQNESGLLVNVTLEPSVRFPLTSSITLIILYTLTTLAALIGNSLAILVFAKGRRSNSDLRHFLINLAVADLIMAIFCIPFTFAYQITDNWIFSDFMCPVVQGCQVVSVAASVSTNTAIGVDRLIAVKFPLRRRVTDSKAKLFIFCIWIFAFSLGIIPFIMCRTTPRSDGTLACEEVFLDEDGRLVYGFFITSVTYFLPVTILSVTYSMIGRILWRHRLPGNADDSRDAAQLKSKRKVVKMLATVVLLFGLCWLPLHLFITITTTFKENLFGNLAYDIYFGVHWLSMANSFVNPVVYGFMNENFRNDLKSLAVFYLCCCGHRRLRYRPAAVRWRLGDSYVHDTSQITNTSFYSKTSTQSSVEMGPMSPAHPRWCRNGRTTSSLPAPHQRSNGVDAPADRKYGRLAGNGTGKRVVVGGRRRQYELCQKDKNLARPEMGNGVALVKSKYNTSRDGVG